MILSGLFNLIYIKRENSRCLYNSFAIIYMSLILMAVGIDHVVNVIRFVVSFRVSKISASLSKGFSLNCAVNYRNIHVYFMNCRHYISDEVETKHCSASAVLRMLVVLRPEASSMISRLLRSSDVPV